MSYICGVVDVDYFGKMYDLKKVEYGKYMNMDNLKIPALKKNTLNRSCKMCSLDNDGKRSILIVQEPSLKTIHLG